MKIHRLATSAAAVLLMLSASACPKTDQTTTTTPTEPQAPAPEPVLEAPVVSAGAVGPLNAGSTVDKASLESLFAGAVVTSETMSAEGEEYEIWVITRAGEKSIMVEPSDGGVHRITVFDKEATTPAGVKIGGTYAELEKTGGSFSCFRLVEDRADDVACYADGAANVGYVFGDIAKIAKSPPGTVPPPAVLRSAVVTSVIWLPEDE